jgi:transposase-like protein
VLVSQKRDLAATHRFFTRALEHGPRSTEVTTDRAPAYPRVLDELLPAACGGRRRTGLIIALGRQIDRHPQVQKPGTTPLPGVCVG